MRSLIHTCLNRSLRYLSAVSLMSLSAFGWAQQQVNTIRDFYDEPGTNLYKETVNDSLNESINPFSGDCKNNCVTAV